jgi:hypothetical protein
MSRDSLLTRDVAYHTNLIEGFWVAIQLWGRGQGQHLSAVKAISHILPFSAQYRTIYYIPHIIAQYIVHRTFSHNLPFSTTVCIISWIKSHRIPSIYVLYIEFDLGRVNTMTRCELIPHIFRLRISKPYNHWSVLVTLLLIITTVRCTLFSPC